MPLHDTRLFSCARCLLLVSICPVCDHGNRYCSPDCADICRRESVRDAGDRYQRSPIGREKHAARQRRYRIRQVGHVTHQGSPPEVLTATLDTAATETGLPAPDADYFSYEDALLPVIVAKDALHDEFVVTTEIQRNQKPIGAAVVHCWLCGRLCLPFTRLDTYKCRARPFGRGCRTRASPQRALRRGLGR